MQQWKKPYVLSNVYVIGTTCFDECFCIPFDNWKTLLLIKVCCCPFSFFNRHVLAFFETRVLKEVRFLHYLRNNSAILITKAPKKNLVYNIFAKCSKLIWLKKTQTLCGSMIFTISGNWFFYNKIFMFL